MLDWVQDTIRRAHAEGWTRLDLGEAGLTAIPEEVWELEWLEVLVLGVGYYDHQNHRWAVSANILWPVGPQNTVAIIPEQIARLSRLRELYLAANKIVDVGPLVALTNLTSDGYTVHADKLVSCLADIHSQTPQLLEANDFATLKQAIDARLQSLRTP